MKGLDVSVAATKGQSRDEGISKSVHGSEKSEEVGSEESESEGNDEESDQDGEEVELDVEDAHRAEFAHRVNRLPSSDLKAAPIPAFTSKSVIPVKGAKDEPSSSGTVSGPCTSTLSCRSDRLHNLIRKYQHPLLGQISFPTYHHPQNPSDLSPHQSSLFSALEVSIYLIHFHLDREHLHPQTPLSSPRSCSQVPIKTSCRH